jgi:hypothetical protein
LGHLALLAALCTAVMAPAGTIDLILEDDAKDRLFSQVKQHNFVFIKNRNFLFDLLKKLFNSEGREIRISKTRYAIHTPNVIRFAAIHFALVTIAAWVFVPGSEPFFHEAHPKAERTGWVVGGYQIHTMILVEWISLYVCTLLLSFPLDYMSATKTLTLATWASGKRKIVRVLTVFFDLFITAIFVCVSFFVLSVLLFNFDLDLPEEVYRFLGGVPIWLSHEDPIAPRFFHAAFVMAAVTVLVMLVTFSLHVASMMWYLLDKLRIFRFFAVQYLRIRTFPFTIAGFALSTILVFTYLLLAILL